MTDRKLSAEQIENWRRALRGQFGPFPSMLDDSEIQGIRNRYQEILDESAPPEDADE